MTAAPLHPVPSLPPLVAGQCPAPYSGPWPTPIRTVPRLPRQTARDNIAEREAA